MEPTAGADLEAPHVAIALADFVSIDADGRVTLVGGGTRVLAVEPVSWHSRPFGVWAAIAVTDAPRRSTIVELVLTGRDGESVRVPDGFGGSKEVRLTQAVVFRPHQTDGLAIPAGDLPLTYDIAVTFASGLLLEPDTSYRWQIELDGRILAAYSFFAARSDEAEIE